MSITKKAYYAQGTYASYSIRLAPTIIAHPHSRVKSLFTKKGNINITFLCKTA